MTVMPLVRFDRDATSIRAVIPTPMGGHIGMSGFPGLVSDLDGTPCIDPSHAHETLTGLKDVGADTVIILTEESELPKDAFPIVSDIAKEAGLSLVFMSIEDYSVPSSTFMAAWRERQQENHRVLASGSTLALCCQYGAGRSGLVAAMLLVEAGMTPGDAIALVRQHFDEAIENDDQENWLYNLG